MSAFVLPEAVIEGDEPLPQAGVIAYRIRRGEVQVLLMTSRDTGRWIIPKGNIKPGASPSKAAVQEAFEEAGGSRGPSSARPRSGCIPITRKWDRERYGPRQLRSFSSRSKGNSVSRGPPEIRAPACARATAVNHKCETSVARCGYGENRPARQGSREIAASLANCA